MGPEEISDSDIDIPILDNKFPVWTKLGTYVGHEGVFEAPSRRKSTNHNHIPSSPNLSPTATRHEKSHVPDSNSKQVSQVINEFDATPAQSGDLPLGGETASNSASNHGGHRRRRFDFKKYVDEDRKIHEYVYKRRFKDFHGALSDSDDDDFSIPATQNDFNENENEISTASSDTADNLSIGDSSHSDLTLPKDISSPNMEQNISNVNPSFTRRHRLIIESDSESESMSDSDVDPDSESDIDTPFVDRRLRQVLPAYTKAVEGRDSLMRDSTVIKAQDGTSLGNINTQDFSSLEESYESQLSFQSTSVYYGEATESRTGCIDFMESHKPPTKQSKEINIITLAQNAGSRAPRTLKIAARTARRRRNLQVQGKHLGLLSKDPLDKLVQKGMIQEKCTNTVKTKSQPYVVESTVGLQRPKYFANQSLDAMHILNRWKRGSLKYDHLIPIKPPEYKKKRRKSRKFTKKRQKVHLQVENYRTPILEKNTNVREFSLRSLPMSEKAYVRPKNSNSEPVTERNRKIIMPIIRSKLRSPRHRVNPTKFSELSFIGSKILEMAHTKCYWDMQIPKSNFGTSIKVTNKAQISKDMQRLIDVSNFLTQDLFEHIYRYFLEATLYLCDESSIITIDFKQFVIHEWLRLARFLLKNSVRLKRKNKLQLQLTQLVVLSALIVSEKTGVLDLQKQKKTKLLAIWVIFYHQDVISAEVDSQFLKESYQSISLELLVATHQLDVWALLHGLLDKIENAEPCWHLLILITCSGNWCDWTLARYLAEKTLGIDSYITMRYIHNLLVVWNWSYSPEIIIDLFNYLAKLQNYADPKGEKISLPKYLVSSNFDGKNIPKQSFALFLELLGLTLRNLRADQLICRKLASRVTPLSALSFPETNEVRPADLSRASHQYGILIVLRRVLSSLTRPHIAQFRDLVVLSSAHWAIRLKALSAWSLVCQIVTAESDYSQCRIWMEDILEGSFKEIVVNAALRTSLEVFNPLSIPIRRLTDLGLQSLLQETRSLAWKLLSLAKLEDEETYSLCKWQHHFSAVDKKAITVILGAKNIQLVHKWCQANPEFLTEVYSHLMESHLLMLPIQLDEIVHVVLDVLLNEKLTPRGISFLKSAQLITERTCLDYHQSTPSNIERRLLIRTILPKLKLTETDCHFALKKVSKIISEISPDRLATYGSIVNELRYFVIASFPDLLGQYRIQVGVENRVLETVHANLLSFTKDTTQSTKNVFYFFVYRLRKLIPVDVHSPKDVDDSSFISDILNALQVTDISLKEKVVQELLDMFYFLFCDAEQVLLRTQKNCVYVILPTLARCARLILGWKNPFSREVGSLIIQICYYLRTRISRDSESLHSAFTLDLCHALSELGIKWINQINWIIEDSDCQECIIINVGEVHQQVCDLLTALETSYVPLVSRPSEYRSSHNSDFGESLMATFHVNKFLCDETVNPKRSEGYQKLKYFQRNLQLFKNMYTPMS